MDSGQIIRNLIIVLIVFIFAAFFVAAEFALVQTRPSVLDEEQKKRSKPSRRIKLAQQMVHNLNEYLSTTQVGVSLCGIILGWIGETTLTDIFINLFKDINFNLNTTSAHIIGAVLGVFLLTYAEVVLTEITPKNISIDMPLRVMMLVALPLHYFHILFYPFVWLLNTSANCIVKMLGLKPASETENAFSQSEILALSKNAVSSGELDQEDYVFMQRAFEMNDKVARDIMIDRTQLVVIDITDDIKTALQVYLTDHYSRIPVVADGDKDKILGYVYNYDLIRQSQIDSSIKVSKILRNIITVPETMPIQDVLNQMIRKQAPIVTVVDEYGGTSGIVTDNDIYEELFGTVRDENDDVSDQYIIKEKNGVYKVSGKTTLYDFQRYFHKEFKTFDESEIVTLAGFILENDPEIQKGDTFKLENFSFTVADYENSYINWFKVTYTKEKTTNNELSNTEENDDNQLKKIDTKQKNNKKEDGL